MEELYWLWLSLAVSPGSHSFKKLLNKFKTVEEIYKASDKMINSAIDPKSSDRAALIDKSLEKATEVRNFCKKMNIGIVTYADKLYPDSLRAIQNPPVLLYYRGEFPNFNDYVTVSIVGTRYPTSYGRKNAYELSYDLAKAGALIVSGMAIGVDGVAHASAIAAEMPTVAVLGSGINVCYPEIHLSLARKIVKSGCVITEYPPNTPPIGNHFPRRNRIIAGLSQATVLIEGAEKSGALITAHIAEENGRKVYAVPGNVNNKMSAAANLLIKSGATAITSAEDVIRDFEKQGRVLLNRFNLSKTRPNIHSVLKGASVSAITPDDDIFTPSRKRITTKEQRVTEVDKRELPKTIASKEIKNKNETQEKEDAPSLAVFDAVALKVYKRIPEGVECSYDSLTGDGVTISDVATAVLKLQIMGFVTVYPGDFVSRKFKG